MYSSRSARFSALHTFQALGNSESPHATTACGAPSRSFKALKDINLDTLEAVIRYGLAAQNEKGKLM
jgi:hypothetical protein